MWQENIPRKNLRNGRKVFSKLEEEKREEMWNLWMKLKVLSEASAADR